MRFLILLCLAVIIADGCVDPIKVAIPEVKFQLVVDGFITNEPGPYTIRLYRARPLITDLDQFVPERFAFVTLKDDQGNSELLTEFGDGGIYQTSANGMQGVIGRKYSIEIKTATRGTYFSEPDELLPPGQIVSLSYSYEADSEIEGFKIFVDATGVEDKRDLLRFRMVGTYQMETFPHLKTRNTEAGPVPDPFPCSGYGVSEAGVLTQMTECTCCTCWVNEYDPIPVVYDEELVTNNQFSNIEVGYVPITRRTFYQKFHVEIQQMSLTESTYQFWKLIRVQKIGESDLFQPAAAHIRGNIRSVNPDEEEPLGIFWTAGISKKSTFINRQDVPHKIKPIDTLRTPCQYSDYSTNIKPSFWE